LIRKIQKTDLNEITLLFKQLWPDTFIKQENIASILDKYLTDENYEIYCFEKEKILGLITLSKRPAFFYGGKVAVIEDIIVDKGKRRFGIGRKLVKFVEREMKTQGIKGIELSSDLYRHEAHQFWEKLGYEKSAFQFRKILNNR